MKIENLIGASVNSVEFDQGSVFVTLSDESRLSAAYWRLLENGVARVSSFDHGEIYGLEEPIDAIAQLRIALAGSTLTNARLNQKTGDIELSFGEKWQLQIFNFSGYEVWEINFSDGSELYSNRVIDQKL